MKQEIMERLFNEKPLTSEQLLYVGSHLSDGEGGVMPDIKSLPKYNHAIKDSIVKACSITDGDLENINKLIKSEVMEKKEDINCDSKYVEIYEKVGLASPINLRILMYQFVKMRNAVNKGMGGFGMKLGGSGPGGLKDFLDFLRGQDPDL